MIDGVSSGRGSLSNKPKNRVHELHPWVSVGSEASSICIEGQSGGKGNVLSLAKNKQTEVNFDRGYHIKVN